MRIVILSDTHGLLRPEVLETLEGADAILHGGDINTQAIVDRLRGCAPLYIVQGNNDKEWAEDIPHDLTVTLGGVRFYMVHNKWGLVAQPRQLRQAALQSGDCLCRDGGGGGALPGGEGDHSPPYQGGLTMREYTTEELTEARRQLASALHKTQEVVKTFQVKENPDRYKSQITLALRRIAAFEISIALIDERLNTK